MNSEVISERTLWVGLSGGVDSVVLLHFAKHFLLNFFDTYPYQLKAVHVNHQLLVEAQDFEQHCRTLCDLWDIPIEVVPVHIDRKSKDSKENLEAKAREARYAVFEKKMGFRDIFVTAHHQEDQAETVLLQLLRGAGLKGASAMPCLTRFGKGYLMRPLLRFTRDEIKQYADTFEIDFIHDPSNYFHDFDRNYLRHIIFPAFYQRWPKASKILARFSEHCANQNRILEEVAEQDFQAVKGKTVRIIQLEKLVGFSVPRQKNILRFWLSHLFGQQVSLPSEKILDKILVMFSAQKDKNPALSTTIRANQFSSHQKINIVFCRYRQELHLMTREELSSRKPLLAPNELDWCERHIDNFKKIVKQCSIQFRVSGEKIKLAGNQYSKTLKHLFQEWGVPPWRRNQIPLIYFRQNLIAVVGYAACDTHELKRLCHTNMI